MILNEMREETVMARVVRFHQTGGPEVLKIENIEVRPPGRGEVRIAVKALGLNRAESMFRSGQYLEDPKFPARLGYEAAGIVEAVGEGVNGLKVGDAVSTIPAFSQNRVWCLWRHRARAGSGRGQAPGVALVDRRGGDLDAIRDRLRRFD